MWLYFNKGKLETPSLWSPGHNCIHALYVRNVNLLRKKEELNTKHCQFTHKLQKIKRFDLAYLNWKEIKKETYRRSSLNLTILLFFSSSVFCFIFSLPWKFWPQLDRKYASFASLVYVWPFFLSNGRWNRLVMSSWPELYYIHYVHEMQICEGKRKNTLHSEFTYKTTHTNVE